MTIYRKEFEDIPGTVLFDITQSRLGYHLNMCCMALLKEENRIAFKNDESTFLQRFPMTEEQRQAVLDRNYSHLIALGGNVYFLGKLSATDGVSFSDMVASMTDSSREDYAQMIRSGGRPIEGNRSKSEWKNRG
jgi:protocatechuate 4,5-dioxygenase alpha chain